MSEKWFAALAKQGIRLPGAFALSIELKGIKAGDSAGGSILDLKVDESDLRAKSFERETIIHPAVHLAPIAKQRFGERPRCISAEDSSYQPKSQTLSYAFDTLFETDMGSWLSSAVCVG